MNPCSTEFKSQATYNWNTLAIQALVLQPMYDQYT